MEKNISLDDVKHIAQLTNLTLSQEEIQKLSVMLSDTLDYVAVLEELDTSDVLETFQVTGLKNIFRDESFPETSLSPEEVLLNASIQKEGKIGTKAVFERE